MGREAAFIRQHRELGAPRRPREALLILKCWATSDTKMAITCEVSSSSAAKRSFLWKLFFKWKKCLHRGYLSPF